MSRDQVQQGTALQLGDHIFRTYALPHLACLANQIDGSLLPEDVAAEQRVRMWSGFFAAAIGCMGADTGKDATKVLAEQLVQVAGSLMPALVASGPMQ